VRRRLDVEMVRRGIAGNPSEAALAIRSGKVAVAGRPAAKASTLVSQEEPITLLGPPRRFVSRGGEKLDAALERFGIDVAGRLALDAGASTGGFTDCLLSRGASHVIALDVGYGQLDWRLRGDPRVTVVERTNIRAVDPDALPYRADLVVADLSFISLAAAMDGLVSCAGPGAEFVLLVKPQFEAQREDVGAGGVVADPGVWRRVLGALSEACAHHGLIVQGVMASPLLGPAGNVEFLLSATRPSGDTDVPDRAEDRVHARNDIPGRAEPGIEEAIEEGISLRARGPGANAEARGAGH
jgi:23S rRNA (cytidine1920-2'-O)/16S rRNA (cytidine1409-2'-O)-methyltransferase